MEDNMGLIKAIGGAIRGEMADQWKEYFYCDALESDVLVTKGEKRTSSRFGSRNNGNDNLITNGSVVAVNEGQCMIIVDQGKVVEFCAEAGEFLYDTSTEPSLLYGDLGENIKKTFAAVGRRFTFGGDTGKDQRVYFFNTKEIMGNKYGTATPVPFRVVDTNIGLDVDISVRCNGEYSYQIFDPLLFYTNVCGNVVDEYRRDTIDSQLKTELMTALQPAFARISAMGIRYSAVPAHTMEVADALNAELSEKWSGLRGIRIVSFGENAITASEDEEARNTAGGMDANALFTMDRQGGAQNGAPASGNPAGNAANADRGGNAASQAESWTCSCGTSNTGNFCVECGKAKPAWQGGWTCSCGAINQGKFCMECGTKKPEGAPLYRCDKCGWRPEDPHHPPKFCPECGDIFDEKDIE